MALFVSFTCSIMESVLLSVPVSYLRVKVEDGMKSAIEFIKLKQNIDKPLAAILSLNTVAHTVGAAGVGAQATIVFGDAYFGIVSAILTLLILVFTEIIPKTIGANFSKELIGIAVKTIKIMVIITYPLVILSSFLTKVFSRKNAEKSISREEIASLAHIGQNEGVFAEKESKIIQNLIKMNTIKITQILTPRVVAVIANSDMTLKEFFNNKEYLRFSRIPIFSNDRDNIIGYIIRESVFEKLTEEKFDMKLRELKRDIIIFPESISLYSAWDELLRKKEHIAIVVDEYGGMAGVVTSEDIIETIFGFEIMDEKDNIEDMQKFALERWKNSSKQFLIHNQNIVDE